jgi:hypothetical protein
MAAPYDCRLVTAVIATAITEAALAALPPEANGVSGSLCGRSPQHPNAKRVLIRLNFFLVLPARE